jgi:hypothetical protein
VKVFRRREQAQAEPSDGAADEAADALDEEGEDDGVDDDSVDDLDDDVRTGLSPRPDGPWDVDEQPDPEGYVDLGGLRIRGREGMELRLEVEEATGAVNAATVQLGESAVQLQAFAAPRSEGIWEEIRAEIAAGITQQGGTVDDVAGVFGRELLARIPARTPDGRTGHQPARFSGIDGPRWFLRAVFHGRAVHDAEAAQELESVVRDVVVVRGADAMAPRELLTLRLPEAVTAQEALEEPGQERTRDDLAPFERGPEITEIH